MEDLVVVRRPQKEHRLEPSHTVSGPVQQFQDARTAEALPEGSTIADLYRRLTARFSKLEAMQKSTLIAVGVDYQGRDYVLREDDEVSLFRPVQGG